VDGAITGGPGTLHRPGIPSLNTTRTQSARGGTCRSPSPSPSPPPPLSHFPARRTVTRAAGLGPRHPAAGLGPGDPAARLRRPGSGPLV